MRGETHQCITRRMRPLLGTFVEVASATDPLATAPSATRDTESRAHADAALRRAFAAIETVERCLSFQNPASELSQLNRCGGRFVTLSALTIRVLRAGRALSIASGGLFNYTVGGALVRRGLLPDHNGAQAFDCGDVRDIEIKGFQARLLRPVLVTLDGIAKGYAVDRGIQALRACGVRAGWINAGGDIRAFGGVTVPIVRRECDGSMRTLGGLCAGAVATSVVHEHADIRFPGEIHAPNGARAGRGTWTVLARSAWKADALTKVAALAPECTRVELLRRLGGVLIEPARSSH
jgi:thiamine biosynthesis lipoprotein